MVQPHFHIFVVADGRRGPVECDVRGPAPPRQEAKSRSDPIISYPMLASASTTAPSIKNTSSSAAVGGDMDGHGGAGAGLDLVMVAQTAVDRYLLENKSTCDPIMARQMKSWTLEYVIGDEEVEKATTCTTSTTDADDSKRPAAARTSSNDDRNQTAAAVKSGEAAAAAAAASSQVHAVRWRGEHATVTLRSTTTTMATTSTALTSCRDRAAVEDQELHVVIQASAELHHHHRDGHEGSGTNSSDRSKDDPRVTTQAAPSTSSSSVRQKVAERLANDDYVSKLLRVVRGRASSTTSTNHHVDAHPAVVLCEAHIVSKTTSCRGPDEIQQGDANINMNANAPPQVEERYMTDENVAEAIRRAVWGSSNDVMDVWEFVLQFLPLLPLQPLSQEQEHESSSNAAASLAAPSASSLVLTPLASRAQLRLLEDAMCDACERHGDDHMVDELSLHVHDEPEEEGDDSNDLEAAGDGRRRHDSAWIDTGGAAASAEEEGDGDRDLRQSQSRRRIRSNKRRRRHRQHQHQG